MGRLRNRVVPPVQAAVTRRSSEEASCRRPQVALPETGSGQETVSPTFGRGTANQAGVAVAVYIHPLVKVIIIFPTSFSVLPWLRLTGRATRAVTPASRPGVRNKNTLRMRHLPTEFINFL